MNNGRLTVSQLIENIRSLLDETNNESIDDERDIVPSLNRAQDLISDILAKQYEVPLLAWIEPTITTQDFPIPLDALSDSIQKVEAKVGSGYVIIPHVDYRKATNLEYDGKVQIPIAYALIDDFIRFYPSPSGGYPLRIWYLKNPPSLDIEQGNITNLNASQNYVIVSDIGDGLSPEVDSFDSYVTIVNGRSGKPKINLQIQYIQGNRIQFRSTPARAEVLGFPISGALPDTITKDDLVCRIGTSAITYVKKPISNYLIQFAVADLRATKLGEDMGDMNKALVSKLEAQCKAMWANQENDITVTLTNPRWRRTYTRSRYRR